MESDKNIILTPLPAGHNDGYVYDKLVATSKVKKFFDKVLQHETRAIRQYEHLPHIITFGISSNKQFLKKELNALGIGGWYNALTARKPGAYKFAPCPWTHEKSIPGGKLIENSGLLFYNEDGKLYVFAFYVNNALLYQNYLERLELGGEPAPFTVELAYTEMLKYILWNGIPRLIQQRKEKGHDDFKQVQKQEYVPAESKKDVD